MRLPSSDPVLHPQMLLVVGFPCPDPVFHTPGLSDGEASSSRSYVTPPDGLVVRLPSSRTGGREIAPRSSRILMLLLFVGCLTPSQPKRLSRGELVT